MSLTKITTPVINLDELSVTLATTSVSGGLLSLIDDKKDVTSLDAMITNGSSRYVRVDSDGVRVVSPTAQTHAFIGDQLAVNLTAIPGSDAASLIVKSRGTGFDSGVKIRAYNVDSPDVIIGSDAINGVAVLDSPGFPFLINPTDGLSVHIGGAVGGERPGALVIHQKEDEVATPGIVIDNVGQGAAIGVSVGGFLYINPANDNRKIGLGTTANADTQVVIGDDFGDVNLGRVALVGRGDVDQRDAGLVIRSNAMTETSDLRIWTQTDNRSHIGAATSLHLDANESQGNIFLNCDVASAISGGNIIAVTDSPSAGSEFKIGTLLHANSRLAVVAKSRANQTGVTVEGVNDDTTIATFYQSAAAVQAGVSLVNIRAKSAPTGDVDSEWDFLHAQTQYGVTGTETAARLTAAGNLHIAGTVSPSGADYAEMFEWLDGNPHAEDRVGLPVKVVGDKIAVATSPTDPIIGVVSATACVVGDAYETGWQGRYLRDDFGRVMHYNSGAPMQSSSYDETRVYVPRDRRPEWAAVGLVGKLRVRKGYPVGSTWIKLKDVSDVVELWLVR